MVQIHKRNIFPKNARVGYWILDLIVVLSGSACLSFVLSVESLVTIRTEYTDHCLNLFFVLSELCDCGALKTSTVYPEESLILFKAVFLTLESLINW